MVGIGVSVRSRGVVGRRGSARGAGASLGKSAERVTSHREDAGARAAETGETAGPDRGGRRTLETARVPREVDAPRNTSETNSSRAPTPRARLIWPAGGEHPTTGPRLRNTVATTTSDSGRKSGPAPAGAHRFFRILFPIRFSRLHPRRPITVRHFPADSEMCDGERARLRLPCAGRALSARTGSPPAFEPRRPPERSPPALRSASRRASSSPPV